MANKIIVTRGKAADLPNLEVGRLGFTTDKNELVVGGEGGNQFFLNEIKFRNFQESGAGYNWIINGGLFVWQRGVSFTNPSNSYTADRIKCNGTGTVAKASNGMQITGTINVRYIMEDIDFAKISGKTVTLSYGLNGAIYTSTFTASSSTIVNLNITNQVLNWIKLEIGDKATPFVPRPYAEELALCQRYYETGSYMWNYFFANFTGATLFANTYIPMKVTKRIAPSTKILNPATGAENSMYNPGTGISITGTSIIPGNTANELQINLNAIDRNIAAFENLMFKWFADAEIY